VEALDWQWTTGVKPEKERVQNAACIGGMAQGIPELEEFEGNTSIAPPEWLPMFRGKRHA